MNCAIEVKWKIEELWWIIDSKIDFVVYVVEKTEEAIANALFNDENISQLLTGWKKVTFVIESMNEVSLN